MNDLTAASNYSFLEVILIWNGHSRNGGGKKKPKAKQKTKKTQELFLESSRHSTHDYRKPDPMA